MFIIIARNKQQKANERTAQRERERQRERDREREREREKRDWLTDLIDLLLILINLTLHWYHGLQFCYHHTTKQSFRAFDHNGLWSECKYTTDLFKTAFITEYAPYFPHFCTGRGNWSWRSKASPASDIARKSPLVRSLLHDGMGVTDIFFQTCTPTGISFSFLFSLSPKAMARKHFFVKNVYLSSSALRNRTGSPFKESKLLSFSTHLPPSTQLFSYQNSRRRRFRKKTRYGSPFPDDACNEDCLLSGQPLSTKKSQDGHSG